MNLILYHLYPHYLAIVPLINHQQQEIRDQSLTVHVIGMFESVSL